MIFSNNNNNNCCYILIFTIVIYYYIVVTIVLFLMALRKCEASVLSRSQHSDLVFSVTTIPIPHILYL